MREMLDAVPGKYGSSLMRKNEIDALVGLLNSTLIVSSILEVGTYEGVTASLIADRCPNSTIVSIDPFIDHDDKDPRRRKGVERLGNWRKNQRPNQFLWVGDLASFYALSPRFFDVVLVDGAHHFEGVLADLEIASLLTAPRGVIAAHDYRDPDWTEVTRAIEQFVQSTSWRIVRHVESLAILQEAGR